MYDKTQLPKLTTFEPVPEPVSKLEENIKALRESTYQAIPALFNLVKALGLHHSLSEDDAVDTLLVALEDTKETLAEAPDALPEPLEEPVEVCMKGLPRPRRPNAPGEVWEHEGMVAELDYYNRGLTLFCPHCHGFWKTTDEDIYKAYKPSTTEMNDSEGMKIALERIKEKYKGQPEGYQYGF